MEKWKLQYEKDGYPDFNNQYPCGECLHWEERVFHTRFGETTSGKCMLYDITVDEKHVEDCYEFDNGRM